jgi:hypothetical protein
MISNIVFTKNRPLQLEGYLESLRRCFPAGLIKTHVLHKPELFEAEYERTFQKFADCTVIRESDFFGDLVSLLAGTETKYILFGVDDVVYFDSVDFSVVNECFERFADDILGFSLRFGGQSLRQGPDVIEQISVGGKTAYRLNWQQGQTPNTRYPFELCATVYPTSLVKNIITSAVSRNPTAQKLFAPSSLLVRALAGIGRARSVLKRFGFFFSPNTFESWNCRWCQRHAEQLPRYVYFQKHCASAVQVNLVNTSTRSDVQDVAEHTPEALAEKYRQGYRLDVDFVAGHKPKGTHCGQEYFRLRQERIVAGIFESGQ